MLAAYPLEALVLGALALTAGGPIHFGAVWLKIADEPAGKRMLGHFWTDRGTAGTLDLSRQQSPKFQTFQSAQAHYAGLP